MIGPGKINNAGGFFEHVEVPYDLEEFNSIMAYLRTMYQHVHGETFVFPDLDDDFVLTSGAGAWGTGGALVEIIPAGGTDRPFDLHWMNIANMSADAEYQVKLYAGAPGEEVVIDPGIRSWRDSTFLAGVETTGAQAIQIPQQSAGTRITARLFSSNAGTATAAINIKGHYYG